MNPLQQRSCRGRKVCGSGAEFLEIEFGQLLVCSATTAMHDVEIPSMDVAEWRLA